MVPETPAPRPPADAPAEPLRGRDREWALLLDALARAGNRPGVLTVEGPAGSGRTRLLRRLAAEARARGHAVHELSGWAAPAEAVRQAAGATVVTWDDPPWTDPELLPALAAAALPTLWVLGRRTGGAPPSAAGGGGAVVELGPLPEPAVAAVLADRLGAVPSADLLGVASLCAGNPAALADLARGLRAQRAVRLRDGTAVLVAPVPPDWVRERVARLLRLLPAAARRLVQVAAAMGLSFDLLDAADLLGDPVARLLPAVEAALGTGLLVSADERLGFGHPLIRVAVGDSVPLSVRRALRAEIERHLATGPALAPNPAPEPARATVLSTVDGLWRAGTLAALVGTVRRALAEPLPAADRAALRCRAAMAHWLAGDPRAAVGAVDPLYEQPDLPAGPHAAAVAIRLVALAEYDAPAARRAAGAVLEGGARPGAAAVAAAGVLSEAAWAAGRLSDSLRLARDAVGYATEPVPRWWRRYARLGLAVRLAGCREPVAAEEMLALARPGSDAGVPDRVWYAAARAGVLLRLDRPAEARTEATAALRLAERIGARLLVPEVSAVLAAVALRAGDLLTADHLVRADPPGTRARWRYDWLRLVLAAEQGGTRAAARLLAERGGTDGERLARLLAEEPGAAAWLVRLGLAVDDRPLCLAAVRATEDLTRDNPGSGSVAAAAGHARGLADGLPHLLARAAREHVDAWARAWAAADLGTLLAERHAPAEALPWLERALREFEAAGAQRDAARLRNQLRGLGAHPASPPPAKAPGTGWDGLSDLERTIVHLANQALTNRQIAARVFLSPHTVNYHLRHIFRKVGVTSRVQLARITEAHLAEPSPRLPGPAGRAGERAAGARSS